MANNLKKTAAKYGKQESPKAATSVLEKEKEERIDWKALARDERTWKIIGAFSLLVAIFLFIAFISYLFTWSQDQDLVLRGSGILLDESVKVNNLLGKLGALVSHFFIYKAFGVASLLICTFFFVVGINLLVNRKVFSIWRNLKYVTIGTLVLSVSLAFILANNEFPYGGGVGKMISAWLVSLLGMVGTGALLFVVALGYFIWQFNPSFNVPQKKVKAIDEGTSAEEAEEEAEVIAERITQQNTLKGNEGMVLVQEEQKPSHEFTVIEKDEPEEEFEASQSPVEEEVVSDLLHAHEEPEPIPPMETKKPAAKSASDLELEIKSMPETTPEEEEEEATAK